MSEETLHRIDSIRQKVNAIHNNLLKERLNNENLQEKIDVLQKNISHLEDENKKILAENVDIKSKLDQASNKDEGAHLFSNAKSSEEIDEMINEIEFCIEHLKSN